MNSAYSFEAETEGVNTLYSHALYSHALYSHALYSHALYSHALYSHAREQKCNECLQSFFGKT